jgi:hypothetical protein
MPNRAAPAEAAGPPASDAQPPPADPAEAERRLERECLDIWRHLRLMAHIHRHD